MEQKPYLKKGTTGLLFEASNVNTKKINLMQPVVTKLIDKLTDLHCARNFIASYLGLDPLIQNKGPRRMNHNAW